MDLEDKAKAFFSLFREMMADCDGFVDENQELLPDITIRAYGELYELPVQRIAVFIFKQMGLLDAVELAAGKPDPNAEIWNLHV